MTDLLDDSTSLLESDLDYSKYSKRAKLEELRANFIKAINLGSTRFEKAGQEWISKVTTDFNLFFDLLDDEASLLEAMNARANRDVAKAPAERAAPDFSWLGSDENREITVDMRDELRQHLSSLISDEHRAFIVRCHARGFSTSDAVKELIGTDEILNRLAQKHVLGEPQLRAFLIPRLAYLKPGSARWPEAKYGATWREAREAHKQTLRDIRFTSQEEQAALLAKQVDRINSEMERGGHSLAEMQLLTNMLIKTVESLRKLSPVDEQQIPVNLSAPQLIAVLERLTLALRAPAQNAIGGETEELVGVLERITLALKAPDQQANSIGAKALPGEVGKDGELE